MKRQSNTQSGGSLVVVIMVTATLLTLLAAAVNYTTQLSHVTQRSGKTALAMEIADGHLETLFTNWRNIYRTTAMSTFGLTQPTNFTLVGTNYFFTTRYSTTPAPTAVPFMSPSPAPTPPSIPLPSTSTFPADPNYTISQYRIQAVDPMITLDASENAMVESTKGTGNYAAMSASAVPPPACGPSPTASPFQFSYFYLAAADVSVPVLSGNVSAKVRRVFEKRFDRPWSYAMFYVDDLELQPSSAFTVTPAATPGQANTVPMGPIHTNGSLYIGTSNFTAAAACEYGADFVNGYSPNDLRYPGSGFTAPNFAKSDPALSLSDCPPSQVGSPLPFGWNVASNQSYHAIIEQPPASGPDPLGKLRYFNQPGYRIVINANGSITITKIDSAGTVTTLAAGSSEYQLFMGSGTTGHGPALILNRPLFDARANGAVQVANFDINQFVFNYSDVQGQGGGLPAAWTGLLYIADTRGATYNADGSVKTAGTAENVTVNGVTTSTVRHAIRLINGSVSPSAGFTVVSPNPVYIQGNYNNSGTRSSAAVVADAVTVLSGAWSDAASASTMSSSRIASNTTICAGIIAGIVPSGPGRYSGGGENFIRLLENWSGKTLTYYGSLVQLYSSDQAIGAWNGDGVTVYISPQTKLFFYDNAVPGSLNPSPPGTLWLSANLQQRWYQVY